MIVTDGRFRGGPLVGRSVNITWYLEWDGLLALTAKVKPDTYLDCSPSAGPERALDGTRQGAASSPDQTTSSPGRCVPNVHS